MQSTGATSSERRNVKLEAQRKNSGDSLSVFEKFFVLAPQGFAGISWRLGWARPLCWRIPERRLNFCPRAGVEGRNAIMLALLPLHPAACDK